jgi:hypothetical protein
MTLSHQYIEQLPPTIAAAVFGNVGNLIAFRVGEHDATHLAREFGDAFQPAEFSSLGNHRVIAKLIDRGEYREPFRGRTLPTISPGYGTRDNLIRRSREKYAVARRIVEDKIERWMHRVHF